MGWACALKNQPRTRKSEERKTERASGRTGGRSMGNKTPATPAVPELNRDGLGHEEICEVVGILKLESQMHVSDRGVLCVLSAIPVIFPCCVSQQIQGRRGVGRPKGTKALERDNAMKKTHTPEYWQKKLEEGRNKGNFLELMHYSVARESGGRTWVGFVRNFRTADSGSNKKHLWEVKYPGEDAGQDVDEMELGELAAGIAKAHAMGAPEKMTLS